MFDRVDWGGYKFTVYDCEYEDWSDVGGLYIVARLTRDQNWTPIYIGKTKSFWSRIPIHEKWPDFQHHGVSHFHIRSEPNEDERERIEYELIRIYQPPLNKHLKF